MKEKSAVMVQMDWYLLLGELSEQYLKIESDSLYKQVGSVERVYQPFWGGGFQEILVVEYTREGNRGKLQSKRWTSQSIGK